MPKRLKKLSNIHKELTKYLLTGLSRAEIARKMNFSTSSVSNKLNELFLEYNAKNKHEFILNIFGEIIDDKKLEISSLRNIINSAGIEIKNLKTFLKNIIKSEQNKNKLSFWINKTKTYLEK